MKISKSLPAPDKLATVFHICVFFSDGVFPFRGEGDVIFFYAKLAEFCEKYKCYLLAATPLKSHTHLVLGSPGGLVAIRKCIRAVNASISRQTRYCQGCEGQIIGQAAVYSAISRPFDLLVRTIYVNENGKTDGHTRVGSLEAEFFYGLPRYINFEGWAYFTGLSREEIKALLSCKDGKTLSEKCRQYDRLFKKYEPRFRIAA